MNAVAESRGVQLSYKAYARDQKAYRPLDDAKLGRYLKEMCPDLKKSKHGGMPTEYHFPPLEVMRKAFTDRYGIRFDDEDVTILPEGAVVVLDGWEAWVPLVDEMRVNPDGDTFTKLRSGHKTVMVDKLIVRLPEFRQWSEWADTGGKPPLKDGW